MHPHIVNFSDRINLNRIRVCILRTVHGIIEAQGPGAVFLPAEDEDKELVFILFMNADILLSPI